MRTLAQIAYEAYTAALLGNGWPWDGMTERVQAAWNAAAEAVADAAKQSFVAVRSQAKLGDEDKMNEAFSPWLKALIREDQAELGRKMPGKK